MAVAALVPELLVTDIDRSLAFYRDVVGFSVRYERPEEGFAFIEREGAQLMLERYDPSGWVTGPMEPPFGRGTSFEISVADVDALHDAVVASGNALFRSLHEAWYRARDLEVGNRQFLVQDPDGYLLRFAADLGTRPPATTSATEPRLSLGADGPSGEPVGQVRLATESDHGAMARLRWTWRVDMGEEPQSTPDAFGAAFGRWLADHAASHVGFVAEVDGEVVGIAFLAIVERVPGPGVWTRLSGYVQSVYVDPGHRGHGLGLALTQAILSQATDRGLDYVSVHPSSPSFPLYRRAGFTDTGRVLQRRL